MGAKLNLVESGAQGGTLEKSGIFLSRNNTVVETHLGADVRLNCRITRDSDYGTVNFTVFHTRRFA